MLFLLAVIGWLAQMAPAAPQEPPAADPISQTHARRQQSQQRVRAEARDLVAGILDIQLMQLEENGLEGTELYRDIRTMREHLDELIETRMPEVVALLATLEETSRAGHDPRWLAVREKSRGILVELLAERQRVLRRLRIAEWTAQVRRLIEAQTRILHMTTTLPEQPPGQRESQVLAAVEDQRDVKAVYARLHATIQEVSSWGGEVGRLATEAFQRLQNAQPDRDMDAAASALQQAKFPESAESQQRVLRALRALLEMLEQAQGLLQNDPHAVREALQQIAHRQQQLRNATSQSDLGQREVERLVEQQGQIEKDLASLADTRQLSAEGHQALQQAQRAAAEATTRLFEAKREEALAEQDRVLDHLKQASQAVEQAAARPAPPSDARLQADRKPATDQHDLLETQIQQLSKDREALTEAASDLEKAARAEHAVAEQSEKAAEQSGLDARQARQLGQQHADVENTVQQVGPRIDLRAPEAAKMLAQAGEPMRRAAEELKAAAQRPSEASKPAAQQVAQQAGQAAEWLDQAAAELRRQARHLAELLAELGEVKAEAALARDDRHSSARRDDSARNRPPAPAPRPPTPPDPNSSRPATASSPSVGPSPDAEPGSSRVQEEPWFAKLPPEVRAAIRANAQRPPPRGYEERLQRYFKSLD